MTDATTARTLLADVTATGGLTLAERVAMTQVWALLEVGEAIGRLGDELGALGRSGALERSEALHGGVRGSERGLGDDDDVTTGRCCPHCRVDLTEHNRAVWNAGYAVGQRHERENR